MGRLADQMKHAFKVEEPGPAEPTETQQPIIDKLCHEVARRRLTTPALMALQMSKPLNFLGSQAMHFFHPIVSALFDTKGYNEFAKYLERRGSIEYLCDRIEHFEKQFERREGKDSRKQPDDPSASNEAQSDQPSDAALKDDHEEH